MNRLPYTAAQRERIAEAVTVAVAKCTPGPVTSVDSLILEDVALQASWRRPASATPRQLAWVRAVIAEAMAQREEGSFR